MEQSLGLYIITSEALNFSHLDVAKAAAIGGADVIQYRDKTSDYKTKLDNAKKIRQIAKEYGAKFIINDEPQLALEVDADGVHLGVEDVDPKKARKIIGEDKIVGVSANNDEEIEYAIKNGADYIGCGPVFYTKTKLDAGNPIGIQGIEDIVSKVEIPVVAIGGIKPDNTQELFKVGVAGVAVASAVAFEDIFKQVRRFRVAIDDFFEMKET